MAARSAWQYPVAIVGSSLVAWVVYTAVQRAMQPPVFVPSPPSELPTQTPYTSSYVGQITGSIRLSAAQANMQSLIFSIAQAKASPRYGANWLPFAQGLVANAYAESKLDPRAVGDSGYARGLFQLNYAKSTSLGTQALKYYTRDQLFDPNVNASFFIDTCLATPQVIAAITSGSAAACTEAICKYVERPTDSTRKAAERVAYMRQLFAGFRVA